MDREQFKGINEGMYANLRDDDIPLQPWWLQVYLPAIAGHVPTEMVQCVAAFLGACYLVCHADISESTITELEKAIAQFHKYRESFHVHGVWPTGFSIPCQHAITHYPCHRHYIVRRCLDTRDLQVGRALDTAQVWRATWRWEGPRPNHSLGRPVLL
jgi:hypothetical protein